MYFLICYDIEKNRQRTKVSNKLIEFGFYRLQYSVFMGAISRTLMKKLQGWLKKESDKFIKPEDSILILRLDGQDLKKMIIFDNERVDRQELLGEKSTLFI
jgi:CRISPR-associated protein Cas2